MHFWRFSASHGMADPVRLTGLGRWRALSLILVIGAVLSCGAAWFAHRLDSRRIQEILEYRAQWRAQDMKAKIAAAAAPIEAVANFVNSTDPIDPAQFQRFAGSVAGDDPTRIIAWAPYVTPDNRAAFERTVESDGHGPFAISEWRPDGSVGPAGERHDYLPIWLEAHASGVTGP